MTNQTVSLARNLVVAAGLLVASAASCSSASTSAATGADAGAPGDGGSGSDDGPAGSDGGTLPDGDAGVRDTFAWAQAFPAGQGSDIVAMAFDSSGVVVVGQITGTATIGATTLTATDSQGNAFAAKLDPSGNVLWAQIASGSQSIFEAVAIDPSGDIFLSGAEGGDSPASVTFAGTTAAPNSISGTIAGSEVSPAAGIVARLDASGHLTWLELVETTKLIDVGALALNGNSLVVAGALDGNAAFGPNETLPITCTTSTTECVFFATYDVATGAASWERVAPSTPPRGNGAGNPHQVQLGLDATGNIFLGIGAAYQVSAGPDLSELVVNEYDPTGALRWNKVFPAGSAQPELTGFAVDATGNSYVLGHDGAGLVFGSTTIDSNATGAFLAKLDPTGNVAWAETLDLIAPGATGLALGTTILTFGDGDDPSTVLPRGAYPMVLGRFDVGTGKLSSTVTCGMGHPDGKVVATRGTVTYVAGDGTSPGVFGRIETTGASDAGGGGFFVARLK